MSNDDGMSLRDMIFHDDAIAVIATLNRASVQRADRNGGTSARFVSVRTKHADTRYL